MILAIGTRVKFRYSGEEGIVREWLDDGMVNVFLEEEDMDIPAFPEDLIRVAVNGPGQDVARVIQTPESRPAEKNQIPTVQQYTILKSLGIQMAFLPENNPDGSTNRYVAYLINDTSSPVLYSCTLYLKDAQKEHRNGKVSPQSYEELGILLFDQLNEAPSYEIECWRVTTQGTGHKLYKQLRLKPKSFFKNTRVAPLLNKQVHWYLVFEDLDGTPSREKKEDLRAYTREQIGAKKPAEPVYGDWRDTLPGVQELAEFEREIDLHIERLTERHARLSNAEILRIQMAHFEAFLHKAIRLGVSNVFVIHGVGKGVLRDAIAQRLRHHSDVALYKNEYHPKYGWGATEVIFEP